MKWIGAGGVAGLAGCSGGGGDGSDGSDGTSGDGSDGSGDGSGGDGGGGTTTSQSGEWPDLSGETLHMVTDSNDDTSQEFWSRITDGFSEATGAETNVEFITAGTEGNQRIIQMIQAGDPPDVSWRSLTQAGVLYQEGILQPLDDIFADVEDRLGEANSVVKETLNLGGEGKVLMPVLNNLNTYNYRTDLVDVEPTDWESALEYARKIDEMDNDVRGTYVPIADGSIGTVRTLSWLWTVGGSIAEWQDDRIHVNFHEGENREKMVELLNYLKDRQQYSPEGAGAGWGDVINIIQNGSAASTWYGGPRPKNAAIRNEREFASGIEVAPMPENTQRGTDGSVEGFISFSQGNTEVAKVFIEYAMQRDFLMFLYHNLGPIHNIPSWPSIKDSDEYISGLKELDIWRGWNEDQLSSLHDDAFQYFQHKSQDTNPPNPYQITYSGEPLWDLQSDVLLRDKNPEDILDQRAQELQAAVDERQG